ncbi:MAG: hypothetical protein H7144_12385 [Burkholderiales bacterium]|nr:hypothetical protein [Phycisphaerae bacterium]
MLCKIAVVLSLLPAPAFAQLRVVSLNASNTGASTSAPRADMSSILSAIGAAESDDPLLPGASGITRPIDILCLQESRSSATTGVAYAALMNQIYSTDRYAAGTLDGATSGAGTQVVVYNTEAVTLQAMAAVGTVTATGSPRQALRYTFRPNGFISDAADLVIYNTHFKAGSATSDRSRRNVEAGDIRADADTFGGGRNLIYLGDFNVARDTEPMYATLSAAGTAKAIDPIRAPGTWSDAAAFKPIHTQSPWDPALAAQTGFNGTAGGMDDRYDFQLISQAVDAGTSGLQYAVNSYNAFGNNGTHAQDAPINSGAGADARVLNALAGILDHLPIVADYNLRPRLGLNLPGDANLSLTTDLTDFSILAAHFNATGQTWFAGDFNADGVAGISDFSILASNFNTSAARPAQVPEPGMCSAIAAMLVIWARHRRPLRANLALAQIV